MRRQGNGRKNGTKPVEAKSVVRAVGYVRCSDAGQTVSDFNALDNQKELIAKCAEHKSGTSETPWELTRFYVDSGLSAKNTGRPALRALLADVKCGRVDAIIVYKLDRISRSVADFCRLDELFQEQGVDLVSVNDNIDTSTPTGRAMRTMSLTYAQLERETIAERIRDKMYAEAKMGRWLGGPTPYGYMLVDRALMPDPIEGPVVQAMFTKYVETRSLSRTRDYINGLGVCRRVRQWAGQTKGGDLWTTQAIDQIIRNERYTGAFTYGPIVKSDHHPALVSKDYFDLANTLPASRVRPNAPQVDHEYLLKGLVNCPHCGGLMTPYYVKHADGKRRRGYTAYYECQRRHKSPGSEPCPVGRYNAGRLEKAIISLLRNLSGDHDTLADAIRQATPLFEALETDSRLEEIRQALPELDKRIERIVDSIEKGGVAASLEQRLRQLDRQRQELKAEAMVLEAEARSQVAPFPSASELEATMAEWVEAIDGTKGPERAELLGLLVERITAVDKKAVSVRLRALPTLPKNDGCSSLRPVWYTRGDSNPGPID